MIKRAFVKVEGTEKLMIDSNGLINDKMEEFSVADSSPEFVQFDAEGSEEFTEGLMADKVEMLVGEGQGEGEGAEALSPSNVLKNGPSPDVEQLLAQAREEAQDIIDEAEARAAGIVSECGCYHGECKERGLQCRPRRGISGGIQRSRGFKAAI